MTIFGKVVMGFFAILLSSLLYFGTASYIRQDVSAPVPETQATSTVVTTASTTEATSTDISATSSVEASSSTSKASTKKIPFTEFMSKGGSYKCDITQTMAAMTASGKVYMHDDLVRVEITSSLAGQSVSTTMIAKDGYMYSWTNLTPEKGYKTKITKSATENSKVYTWNGSQVGDYTCEAWKADDTLFELPKTVTFTVQ